MWREAVLQLAAAGVPAEEWPRVFEWCPRSSVQPHEVREEKRREFLLYLLPRWEFTDTRFRRFPDSLVTRVANAISARVPDENGRREAWAHNLALGLIGEAAARLSGEEEQQEEVERRVGEQLATLPDPLDLITVLRTAHDIDRRGNPRQILYGDSSDSERIYRRVAGERGWILGWLEMDRRWLYQVSTVVCFVRSEVTAAVKSAAREPAPPARQKRYFADSPHPFVWAEEAAPYLRRASKPPTIWPDLYWRNSTTRGSPVPATLEECRKWSCALFGGDFGKYTYRRSHELHGEEIPPPGFDEIMSSGSGAEKKVSGYEPIELFVHLGHRDRSSRGS